MRRPRIVWRVPPGSVYRTTHGGTRLVVDKAKLRAKVQAAVRKQAAPGAPVRRAGPQPAGRPGSRGNPAARRAQAIEQMKNQPPERLLAGFISNGRLVWVRHPEEMKDYLVEPGTGCMVIGFNGQPVTRSTRFSWKRVPLKMDLLKKHLEKSEGRYRPMHPDPDGHVTVGIGHKLGGVEDALDMPFEFQPGEDGPDLEDAVRRDYATALTLPRGQLEDFYLLRTTTQLSRAYIDELLDSDVARTRRQLTAGNRFPKFETYPEPVRRGMIDLAFNMGTTKFHTKFRIFGAAIALRMWKRVAVEARRSEKHAGDVDRNDKVQPWFQEAAKAEPHFIDPGCKIPIINYVSGGRRI